MTFTIFAKISMINIINMYINATFNALKLLLMPIIMVNIIKNSYTCVYE